MWSFSDFQYSFRSSWSIAHLLTVVSDRISRAFNRSRATRAVAFDISKAFNRVWYAGLPHKLKSFGIPGQIFGLISSFLSNRQLHVVLLFWVANVHKNIQLMLEFLKAPFLVLHPSYYTLKVVTITFVLVRFLSLKESTCQSRKNVFNFTSKALFVLEKIKF